MMRRIAIAFVFLCLCISSLAQSGQMTSYERGRYEIANTALKKVTEPMTSDQQLLIALVYTKMKKEVEDIFDETTVMENIVYKYCGLDKDLVTDANYLPQFSYPEKNLIGNYQRSWQSVAKWYRTERLKLEARKTAADKARERERNNYKKGKGEILNNISKSFISWAMRRDGEDDTAYHVRLNTHALEVFDSLSYKFCDAAWKPAMLVVKGRYFDNPGELELKYYNVADVESTPLSGRFSTNRFDAANLKESDIVVEETHALGLSFREGLCYPSTLCLSCKGMKNEIELALSADDHFTIKGESVKISGTKRFIDAVTPYLKNHIFDYAEYAASRVYRNKLFNKMYSVYNRYVYIAGADPGIRIEQFMPQGNHFSRKVAAQVVADFHAYCLVAAQRGLYGRYIDKCANHISLAGAADVLKNGSIDACYDAVGKAVCRYLFSSAGKITKEQVKASYPQGELADALALIFGMYMSECDLDVDSIAGQFVGQCRPLNSKFNMNKSKFKEDEAPYVSFLMNTYPEFAKIKK